MHTGAIEQSFITDATLTLTPSTIIDTTEGETLESCCFVLTTGGETECPIEASLTMNSGKYTATDFPCAHFKLHIERMPKSYIL